MFLFKKTNEYLEKFIIYFLLGKVRLYKWAPKKSSSEIRWNALGWHLLFVNSTLVDTRQLSIVKRLKNDMTKKPSYSLIMNGQTPTNQILHASYYQIQ